MILSIAERHKYILDTLRRDGFVKVIDVAKKLDVTTVTVRKDLKILEDKGLLYRTHGSASSVNPHAKDKNVREKEKIKTREKELIGARAALLIEEDDSIIINSGSTVCAFAEQIAPVGHLKVVTSSIKAASKLADIDGVTVLQLGGVLRRSSMSVIGNYTLSLLENITCSKFFLGVDGIDLDYGVTTSNIEEAELNKAMMQVSLRTIVLCDSSKFGRKGFGKICGIDKIDVIVTDSGVSEHMRKSLEEFGVQVIVVD